MSCIWEVRPLRWLCSSGFLVSCRTPSPAVGHAWMFIRPQGGPQQNPNMHQHQQPQGCGMMGGGFGPSSASSFGGAGFGGGGNFGSCAGFGGGGGPPPGGGIRAKTTSHTAQSQRVSGPRPPLNSTRTCAPSKKHTPGPILIQAPAHTMTWTRGEVNRGGRLRKCIQHHVFDISDFAVVIVVVGTVVHVAPERDVDVVSRARLPEVCRWLPWGSGPGNPFPEIISFQFNLWVAQDLWS
jgi:hypothetical protein